MLDVEALAALVALRSGAHDLRWLLAANPSAANRVLPGAIPGAEDCARTTRGGRCSPEDGVPRDGMDDTARGGSPRHVWELASVFGHDESSTAAAVELAEGVAGGVCCGADGAAPSIRS